MSMNKMMMAMRHILSIISLLLILVLASVGLMVTVGSFGIVAVAGFWVLLYQSHIGNVMKQEINKLNECGGKLKSDN